MRCRCKKPVLLVACLLALSCSKTYVDLNGTASPDPDDYTDVFLAWSRPVKVIPINGLDNVLIATATYLSPSFRRTYVARVASDVDMTEGERGALLAEEMGRAEKGHEFYVTLLSGVKDCDDLDPEEGPWRIRLIDDTGREVSPLSVEEIDRPSAREIQYFNFDPGQRKAYRILFPKAAQDGAPILSGATGHFDLAFASAYGKNRARWETTKNAPKE